GTWTADEFVPGSRSRPRPFLTRSDSSAAHPSLNPKNEKGHSIRQNRMLPTMLETSPLRPSIPDELRRRTDDVRTGVPLRASRAEEVRTLRRLWRLQLDHATTRGLSDSDPGMAYLTSHFAMDLTLERHLRVLDRLLPYIRWRVLEWGCRHGLDSCIYRMRLGDAVE